MIYFLIIITLLFIMPIKIKITRNDKKNDLDLILTKIFNITIDLDELIKYFLTTKENRSKITVDSVLYNIGLFRRLKNIFITILRMVSVSKLTLITKQNIKSIERDVYVYVLSWTFLNFFKNKIRRKVYNINNEYYSVTKNDNVKIYDINFECDFNIRLLYVLLAVIINIKDIPKIIKYVKGSRKNELTSNI